MQLSVSCAWVLNNGQQLSASLSNKTHSAPDEGWPQRPMLIKGLNQKIITMHFQITVSVCLACLPVLIMRGTTSIHSSGMRDNNMMMTVTLGSVSQEMSLSFFFALSVCVWGTDCVLPVRLSVVCVWALRRCTWRHWAVWLTENIRKKEKNIT